MQLRHEQAAHLAQFIASLREDWGVAGVMHALGEARCMGDAYDVAHAALSAASRAENRTPAVIALPGPHWGHTGVRHKNPRQISGPTLCGICSEPPDRCASLWSADHKFEDPTKRRPAKRPVKEHHE